MLSIGLMSGTSLDGIDVAIIHSDGEKVFSIGHSDHVSYPERFRVALRRISGREIGVETKLERELTLRHADAVCSVMSKAGLKSSDVGVVGFPGQTVFHQPKKKITCQLGDGALLAETIGITVINDFRSKDVASGGEGAPFAPLFHVALSKSLERPIAILNLGGVANVTWIGSNENFIAFDTGPGNAMIDDWVNNHGYGSMDQGGELAKSGHINKIVLNNLMKNRYFVRSIPKSLDRDFFSPSLVAELSLKDGAATLTAFSAAAVAESLKYLPLKPLRWLVSGGGRHNGALMNALRKCLNSPVETVEAVGWDGDALEAQAFAYLAVRSLLNMPISFPNTTGVLHPMTGGVRHNPVLSFSSD